MSNDCALSQLARERPNGGCGWRLDGERRGTNFYLARIEWVAFPRGDQLDPVASPGTAGTCCLIGGPGLIRLRILMC